MAETTAKQRRKRNSRISPDDWSVADAGGSEITVSLIAVPLGTETVEYRVNDAGPWTAFDAVDPDDYTISALDAGLTSVRLRASGVFGQGAVSAAKTATVTT